MNEETNDLTAREILDFLLILPFFWAFMVIGTAIVIVGKILDFFSWVRKKIERLK